MSEGLSNIPEAAYNLRVHKAEYVAQPKTAGAKGPYIKTQLVVTGPALNGADNPHVGRFVFMNYSLTGDGSFRLREMLEVTGHPPEFQLTDSDQLIGLEFGAAVIVKEPSIAEAAKGYTAKNEIKKHVALL
jgi:hypothetical protein